MIRNVKISLVIAAVLLVGVIAAGLFIESGLYNIGADDHHTKIVLATIEQLRERSVGVRARAVEVPRLEDPKRVMAGAQRYAALCVGCHLAPGVTKSDIRAFKTEQLRNVGITRVALALRSPGFTGAHGADESTQQSLRLERRPRSDTYLQQFNAQA